VSGQEWSLQAAGEVAEEALAASVGDGCVVIVEDTSEAELRFALNSVTGNGVRRTRRVTVISMIGRSGGLGVGSASSSGTGDPVELVRAAEVDAAAAEPAGDEFALVGPEDSVARGALGPEPATTGIEALGGVISGLGPALRRAEAGEYLVAGFASQEMSTLTVATSAGLRLRHVQPTAKLELTARADNGARSAWVGAGSGDFSSVPLEELEDKLVRRLSWATRRVDLEPGRYEVLLPPEAVADLVLLAGEAASGRQAEEGRCVFSGPEGTTRLGEVISEKAFSLRSDPREPGVECAPFLVSGASSEDVSVFDNGLALERTEWMAGGRLERLRYHRAGAARSGRPVAPPIDNLILELPGATSSLDDMIAGSERALLLTCLWYIREVDPVTLLVTGLTRDGVYLVENGEIVAAVNNFRFNESPIDVLARCTEVGRSERALSREWNEWMSRTVMPPLRVAEFNMSSVSPAT